MTTPLLAVEGLKKHFPVKEPGRLVAKTLYAVDGVSFTIGHGETVGLVGESGCGKSTLGRTIIRLHALTAGKVVFNGNDISLLRPSQLRSYRRKMQIVFQDPFSSLNPRMTVGQILSEPYLIHNLGKPQEIADKVNGLLATVGLSSDAISRYPHEFSGGQRQRIGIARAIALEPDLVVADEPVSALDVSIQSQILNLLSDLKHKLGLSYLFIAHDLAVIEHISDRVAVMYLGRIVEFAAAGVLYSGPLHPYTRALIEAIPEPVYRANRQRNVLAGDVPSPIDPPSGCHFHTRCPFVTEECRRRVPELRNMGTDQHPHWVACHYASEI